MVCLMRQFLVAPPGHVLSPIRGNEHKVGVNFTAGNSQFPFSSPPTIFNNAPPLKNDKDNDVVSFHTLTSTNSPLETFHPKKFPLSKLFMPVFVSLYVVFFGCFKVVFFHHEITVRAFIGLVLWWLSFKEVFPEQICHYCNIRMLFSRFEEISYAVGYLATLTFPLLYLKSWQEDGTYNTKKKNICS